MDKSETKMEGEKKRKKNIIWLNVKRNDPIGHGRRMTIVGNGKSHELIDSIKQFNGVDVEWK
ncbi:hypothetical protein BLOT_008093 [Blomia tropicalis]|nr:hypothetical protein BLOT_008093 [Blomia tropicalis]